MKRHHRMLAMALGLPLLAIGLPYWQADYGTPATQLPSALLWWPVVLVFFGAVASRLAGAAFLLAWAVAGSPIPLVVLVRVLVDTGVEPTTHGLWPLELAIAAAVGYGAALLGALVGHAAIRLRSGPPANG